MISLGPFPMSLAVLVLALATGALVARSMVMPEPGQPALKPLATMLDMLMVGVVVARLAFVLVWLPEYLAEPWSILRIGDGGFALWAGIPAGLAFGAWRARNMHALRRPLAFGAAAGLAAWALLGGALLMMQQAAVKLPTTELGTLDGGSVQLSTMAGKPMVLNLWATWCPPCRREMPVLARAQAKRGDVNFVFVNQGEAGSLVRTYLGESQLQLDNVLLDPFSNVMRESGSRGLPTTLFFDAQGRLVDTHMGELTDAGLAVKLKRFGPAPRATPAP